MIIDVYYWFDKSTKRKAELADYYTFCDVAYRDIGFYSNMLVLEAIFYLEVFLNFLS